LASQSAQNDLQLYKYEDRNEKHTRLEGNIKKQADGENVTINGK
jgi:hypothetical protein